MDHIFDTTRIIVAGNLSDGFTFIGPFGDWEELQQYAEDNRVGEYWGATLARPVSVDEQLTDDDYAIIQEEKES